MANQDKKGFMYIYKGGTGNQRKKELDHVVEKEKKPSWLHRIRNSTRNFNFNVGHRDLQNEVLGKGGFVDARKSTSCIELELELESRRGEGGYIEGRKSVSCIEASSSPAISKGIIIEEGRKSVSHIETKLAEAKKASRIVEGRKSVSQIETFSSVAAKLQVKILVSDMPSFMQLHAFRWARRTYDSLEEFSSKHIAYNIKKVCFHLTFMLVNFTSSKLPLLLPSKGHSVFFSGPLPVNDEFPIVLSNERLIPTHV